MDLGDWTPGEMRANLRDIARINRSLGGLRTLTAHLYPRLKRAWATRRSDRPLSLLDVGSGPADIPVEIVRWAQAQSLPIRVWALDIRPEHLRAGREGTARLPELGLVQAEALRLPFSQVDFVTASLTLHHFPPAQAVLLLSELRRVARRAVLVNDLIRSRIPYWFSPLVGRLMCWSSMTRHDARLSILRAYTMNEAIGLAHEAGLRNVRVHWHWPWRMCVVSDA